MDDVIFSELIVKMLVIPSTFHSTPSSDQSFNLSKIPAKLALCFVLTSKYIMVNVPAWHA